ncbi:MAG TPA: hypothetical protein VEC56_09655 [Candidatus Krumholzibacteria bacterium]|nr:hypothetical protein [Candidatus Krumholzibacteria bacterium]
MAPVAYGALATVAGTVVISVMVGVIIGTAVVRLNNGLAWGFLAVGIYLLTAPSMMDSPELPFASLNASPLILTFLSSSLAGRFFGIHRKSSAVGATLLALGSGLVIGAAYLLLFRALFLTNRWTPPLVALVADVCLAAAALRVRRFRVP